MPELPVAKDNEFVEQLMTGHTGQVASAAHSIVTGPTIPVPTTANQHLPPGDRSQLRPVIPADP
jgi:hypothetical protein